eukprot:TRINITY_DN13681_c0_g1_i1.p1 TRINITY_DN13681_c0_g1~~TRINITY_DN13681_c0_g1_i1.p1  ORF type:complete len:429 (-),score=64.15 TRINITY_DN13681_c0_g1_i1:49-1335(-)
MARTAAAMCTTVATFIVSVSLLFEATATASDADNEQGEGVGTCSGLDMKPWLQTENSMKGFDVVCISQAEGDCNSVGADADSTCPAGGRWRVAAHWGGTRKLSEEFVMDAPAKLLQFEEQLGKRRPLTNNKRYNRLKAGMKDKWKGIHGFYKVQSSDKVPKRIESARELFGLVLIFEGGAFLWPGVHTGYQRNITVEMGGTNGLSLELRTRSLVPLIFEVSSFLQDEECDHIIRKAMPHIKKSAVSHMDHDVGKPATEWRSSSTYFMNSDDDVTRELDRRVGAVTNTLVSQQEQSQILRYERGERYAAHHDFFNVEMYKQDKMVQDLTKKGLFNRLATVFFYMADVEAGGQTHFPRAGGLPQPTDFEDCSLGVSVFPQKGRIIIFYSLDAAGTPDEYSLHGGCAVQTGTKWSANKWIWNKRMHFLPDP